MGVLACDRKGCTKIMCDRYSEEFGYICDECFDELHDEMAWAEEAESAASVYKRFMDSPKLPKVDPDPDKEFHKTR